MASNSVTTTILDLSTLRKSSAQIKEELFAEMVSAMRDCAPHVAHVLGELWEEYLLAQAHEKADADRKYYDL